MPFSYKFSIKPSCKDFLSWFTLSSGHCVLGSIVLELFILGIIAQLGLLFLTHGIPFLGHIVHGTIHPRLHCPRTIHPRT